MTERIKEVTMRGHLREQGSRYIHSKNQNIRSAVSGISLKILPLWAGV